MKNELRSASLRLRLATQSAIGVAMSETFEQFVVRRKAELKAILDAASIEFDQLCEAEKLIPARAPPTEKPRHVRVTSAGSLTLKDMALQVLRDHPDGLDALKIIACIRADFGISVPRTSMSPQLSRLGADKVLERIGMTWRIKRPGSEQSRADLFKNEAPATGELDTRPGASASDEPSREVHQE